MLLSKGMGRCPAPCPSVRCQPAALLQENRAVLSSQPHQVITSTRLWHSSIEDFGAVGAIARASPTHLIIMIMHRHIVIDDKKNKSEDVGAVICGLHIHTHPAPEPE